MTFHIRPFQDTDADHLVEILRANDQYGYPDVEGPMPSMMAHER